MNHVFELCPTRRDKEGDGECTSLNDMFSFEEVCPIVQSSPNCNCTIPHHVWYNGQADALFVDVKRDPSHDKRQWFQTWKNVYSAPSHKLREWFQPVFLEFLFHGADSSSWFAVRKNTFVRTHHVPLQCPAVLIDQLRDAQERRSYDQRVEDIVIGTERIFTFNYLEIDDCVWFPRPRDKSCLVPICDADWLVEPRLCSTFVHHVMSSFTTLSHRNGFEEGEKVESTTLPRKYTTELLECLEVYVFPTELSWIVSDTVRLWHILDGRWCFFGLLLNATEVLSSNVLSSTQAEPIRLAQHCWNANATLSYPVAHLKLSPRQAAQHCMTSWRAVRASEQNESVRWGSMCRCSTIHSTSDESCHVNSITTVLDRALLRMIESDPRCVNSNFYFGDDSIRVEVSSCERAHLDRHMDRHLDTLDALDLWSATFHDVKFVRRDVTSFFTIDAFSSKTFVLRTDEDDMTVSSVEQIATTWKTPHATVTPRSLEIVEISVHGPFPQRAGICCLGNERNKILSLCEHLKPRSAWQLQLLIQSRSHPQVSYAQSCSCRTHRSNQFALSRERQQMYLDEFLRMCSRGAVPVFVSGRTITTDVQFDPVVSDHDSDHEYVEFVACTTYFRQPVRCFKHSRQHIDTWCRIVEFKTVWQFEMFLLSVSSFLGSMTVGSWAELVVRQRAEYVDMYAHILKHMPLRQSEQCDRVGR